VGSRAVVPATATATASDGAGFASAGSGLLIPACIGSRRHPFLSIGRGGAIVSARRALSLLGARRVAGPRGRGLIRHGWRADTHTAAGGTADASVGAWGPTNRIESGDPSR